MSDMWINDTFDGEDYVSSYTVKIKVNDETDARSIDQTFVSFEKSPGCLQQGVVITHVGEDALHKSSILLQDFFLAMRSFDSAIERVKQKRREDLEEMLKNVKIVQFLQEKDPFFFVEPVHDDRIPFESASRCSLVVRLFNEKIDVWQWHYLRTDLEKTLEDKHNTLYGEYLEYNMRGYEAE